MILKPTIYMASLTLFTALIWGVSESGHGADSEYSGKSPGKIKTLSPEELHSLTTGDGTAYSKAAEVNHYPSPKLVLSLAKELNLTKQQFIETQALYEQTKTKSIQLGSTIIKKERELEQSFFSGSVNATYLKKLVDEISATTASLRYLHLQSYIDQVKLLTNDQIFYLDQLRTNNRNEGRNKPHDHDHDH